MHQIRARWKNHYQRLFYWQHHRDGSPGYCYCAVDGSYARNCRDDYAEIRHHADCHGGNPVRCTDIPAISAICVLIAGVLGAGVRPICC